MATAETRPHPTNLWTDVQLQRLPGDVRRMLDYLMTGPDVNAAGVTQIEDGVIAARIGFHQLTVDTTIQILANHGEVYVDWETREAWPVRWARFHKFEKAIAVKAFSKGMLDIKSSELKRLISGKIQLKQGASRQQQQQHQHQQRESSGNAAPATSENQELQNLGSASGSCGSAALWASSEDYLEHLRAAGARCKGADLERDRQTITKLRSIIDELGLDRVLAAAAGASPPSQVERACKESGLADAAEIQMKKRREEESEAAGNAKKNNLYKHSIALQNFDAATAAAGAVKFNLKPRTAGAA